MDNGNIWNYLHQHNSRLQVCMCNRQGSKIITPHYDIMMTSLTVVFLSDFRLKYDVYYFYICFVAHKLNLYLKQMQ